MPSRKRDYRQVAKKFATKLKKIRLVLLDVDGILTTGHVYYAGKEVGFNRFFHVADGYIIKVLMRAGIQVGIISGGKSLGLRQRIGDLGIKLAFLGNEDKREAYLEALKMADCSDKETLYMGDELFDIPLLKRAGFAVTVPHAPIEVHEVADYVTEREGGHGCVREMADILRYAQGIVPVVDDFEN